MNQKTENGVFLLKKLNAEGKGAKKASFFLFVSFSLLWFCAGLFASCKTAPVQSVYVDPLELLDSESSFFLSIPYSADPLLMTTIIESNIQDITHENAENAAKRIDVVYAGFIKSRKSMELQLSGKVDFPKLVQSKVFTRKNGWIESSVEFKNKNEISEKYSIWSNNGLDLSLPGENLVVLGRDTKGMVEKYHAKVNDITLEGETALIAPVKEYLSFTDEDRVEPKIKFYATRPQSFLTMLTGANLTLRLLYVRGSMKVDPKLKKQYLMDLEFEFKDSRTVPAARGALSVAFGLTDSDVTQETPWHLTISNIKIDREQLYKLLLLI